MRHLCSSELRIKPGLILTFSKTSKNVVGVHNRIFVGVHNRSPQ